MPPITGPRVAAFSSRADITRWKTSCCGIEPNIMVIAAAMKNMISVKLGSGKNLNRSLLAASSITLSAPPARLAAKMAIADSPTTRMIICTKSVTATDHMPPNRV